jgi:hypothetical protein
LGDSSVKFFEKYFGMRIKMQKNPDRSARSTAVVHNLNSRMFYTAKLGKILFSTKFSRHAAVHTSMYTVPLYKSKLFISRSCPILVLRTVLGRPRRADIKKNVEKYQGPKKGFLSRF